MESDPGGKFGRAMSVPFLWIPRYHMLRRPHARCPTPNPRWEAVMKKFIFASGAAATLLSMVLLAADIDGKWVLETQGQNGKATQTLMLKAEGGKLTGTIDNQGTVVDGKVNINDGTLDGSKVAFTVVRDMHRDHSEVLGNDGRRRAETEGRDYRWSWRRPGRGSGDGVQEAIAS